MNNRQDIEAIARQIDFQRLESRIDQLTHSANHKKTLGDLLAPLKPALLRARERNASMAALVQCLRDSGILISEPTLRYYLRGTAGQSKRRRPGKNRSNNASVKRPPTASQSPAKTTPPPQSQPQSTTPTTNPARPKQTPPRLAI